MKYITRDILQGKLKLSRYYSVTCFYAPKGSGKTRQIKAYIETRHIRRKWFDLVHYPLNGTKKIKALKEACIQIDSEVFLIFEHYNSEYLDFINELSTTIGNTILLITDEIQDTFYKSWNYIDFHDICLSKGELYTVCQINEINITQNDLNYIFNATFGWYPAVEIFLNHYMHYHEIMEVQQLNALFDDIYRYASIRLSALLPILSLCNTFSMDLCKYMGASAATLKELEKLAANGWMIRKTADQQHYELASAMRHYLKRELHYKEVDITKLHLVYAKWSEDHHQTIEALYHYYQAMEYDDIIRILENSQSVTLVDISTDLISEIYQNIPVEKLRKSPYAYLRVINDMLTSLDIMQGIKMLEDFEKHLSNYTVSKNKLYGELHLIYGYMNINNIYEMNDCFKKAYEFFQGETSRISSIGMNVTLGAPHTMYIYHRTPGDFAHLVTYIEEELHYYLDITGNLNAGFIEQSKAELWMETGKFNQALQQAWEAYYVAQTYQQQSIMICSMFTIMRCTNLLYDDELLKIITERLLNQLDNNENIYQLYAIHCSLGYICAVNRNTEEANYHLQQIDNTAIIDSNYFLYVVKGTLLLYLHEYEKLKAVAAIMLDYYRHEPHAIGEIYAYIFKAVCYYHQARLDIAKKKFQRAIEVSKPDGIILPYLELYQEIEPLIIIFQDDSFIESVISFYGRIDCGLGSYKSRLTQKEFEVAKLMAKGYTRKDIACMMHVSTETINSHAKKLFSKLKIHTWRELQDISLNDEI